MTAASSDEATAAASRPAWRDIAYGSAAGMASKLFEHPFDLVKVRLQSQPLDRPQRFTGPVDCFTQTFMREGAKGLYRGLSMPLIGAMAENAALFLVYNQTRQLLRSVYPCDEAAAAAGHPPIGQILVAAGCAGAAASFLLTPIELIKCRMQVQMLTLESNMPASAPASAQSRLATNALKPKVAPAAAFSTSTAQAKAETMSFRARAAELPGALVLARQQIAQKGFRGLWLGQTGTLFRETGGSAAWFLAFEVVSSYFIRARRRQQAVTGAEPTFTRRDLKPWQLMLAGASAGMSYNAILFPADSIKSAMQTHDEMGGGTHSKPTGFLQTGRNIYASRGIKGLYSGAGITIARAAPSSAIIFVLYGELEKLFG
ncbi:uncharacterized protein L969DRAFT_54266 [Mixia osmundae IAM 14324]|uniref:Mitochondrial carrier n=1 Tax=Mixia osmundae (strain CBS 9802 / IAM 14324 / JCM 22182 / KY 12970) TaxID=764103 RepID=G7E2C8_MIXOS|nr:uncharacterized protein L969DRAFT_54266 [Mixia osmundae IAM 14324]KEI36860.1 hypothetical protein L969DRAFT_54266 [Mixia osmundae IAM 14324]GAA96988.1 hypothetical protein E5Q_03662 [Mixia osmundae IAM 14324]